MCEQKSIDRGDDDERVINLSSFRRGRDARLFVREEEEKKRGGLTDARVKRRRRGGLTGQKRKTGQTSLSVLETPRATETEQRGFLFFKRLARNEGEETYCIGYKTTRGQTLIRRRRGKEPERKKDISG